MSKIQPGQTIWIHCQVQPGPFSEEQLITLNTINGPISGFVKEEELQSKSENEWFVRGVVHSIDTNSIVVRISGSFLTTNGLANVAFNEAIAA